MAQDRDGVQEKRLYGRMQASGPASGLVFAGLTRFCNDEAELCLEDFERIREAP